MTTVLSPQEIRDERTLASRLAELGLPGHRSMTAIKRIRTDRARRAQLAMPRALASRFESWLIDTYTQEVHRRGGEIEIATGGRPKSLQISDRRDEMVLLHVSGWRKYSNNFGSRHASLSYLCGKDDSGRWAVRVPGTIATIAAALEWITPADVRKTKRRIRRQGDIYAIETTRAHDTPSGWIGDDRRWDPGRRQMVTSHFWNADTRYLTHHPSDGRKHRPMKLSFPVRFAQQRALRMGRGAGWGSGD